MKTYPTKKLGEVCGIVGGGTPSTSVSEYWNGDVVWITPKDMGQLDDVEIFDSSKKITEEGLKKSSAKLLPKGAVILSSRAPIGYVAIAGVPLATNQGCRSFICEESKLYNRYLLHFLLTQTEHLNMLGGGSTFKEISGSKLRELEIPLPPLSEQKKIVAKLERVLAKINEAKKLRAEARENADNLLPAKLHKIFENWKKKGWEEKELGEISNEINSGFACGKQNEVSNGVVHLRTHNIDTEGNLNFDKITQIPKDLVVQSAFGLEKGDILFNNTNSTELVGKTALVTEGLPYAFSNHLTRIKVIKNKALAEWIVYVFNTSWKDKYFESICTRWVGQSGINQTALKKIKIPLPPLDEQKKIVARLDSLSEKIGKIKNLQSATQNDFIALEQSLLQQAFAGHAILPKSFSTKQHSNIL